MQEKRQHPRVPISLDLKCEIADAAEILGTAGDISLGGLFVQTEVTPPAFGTNLTIVTRLPGLSGEVRLPAIVRWNKAGGFGVQFQLLGARETHANTDLMRH